MYSDSEIFLEELPKYDKHAKICIDNSLKTEIGSFELAERLYNAGYTRLYLLSGILRKDMDQVNYHII